MEFCHPDGRTVPVLLPPRSVLIMTGESRYIWSHAIPPRKSDVLPVSVLRTLCYGGNIMQTVEHVDDFASSVTSMVLDDTANEGAHAGDNQPCNGNEDRLTLAKRGVRTSFTFRKILTDPNNYGRYYCCYFSKSDCSCTVLVLFSHIHNFSLAPLQHFTSVSTKSW